MKRASMCPHSGQPTLLEESTEDPKPAVAFLEQAGQGSRRRGRTAATLALTTLDRENLDVLQALAVLRAHREIQQLADDLDLPTPFSEAAWAECVSRHMGRPIYTGVLPRQLLVMLAALCPDHISGFTFTYRDGWLILLAEDLDTLRRSLAFGHEIAHIVFGDVPPGDDPDTNTDIAAALFELLGVGRTAQPDARPDAASPVEQSTRRKAAESDTTVLAAAHAAARGGYVLAREQRAERLGTLVMAKAASGAPGRRWG